MVKDLNGARPLLALERRERIVDLAVRQGFVRVDELSSVLQVSEVTIRGDLDALAKQGRLLRDRGGAIANVSSNLTVAFDQRAVLNQDEKRRIGQAAAELVQPGDTIIMDSGTTVMEMAKSLIGPAPKTVVTNALNVATQVGALPETNVILLGGALDRNTICTFGPHTERVLSELVVQKAFLGTTGFDLELGLTDTSIELVQVKRAMINAARQVILLADSSKWERVSFAKVVPLSAVHVVITDSGLPNEARLAMERLRIQVILT